MLSLQNRIDLMVALGGQLRNGSEAQDAAIRRAVAHNGWFTPETIGTAIENIVSGYLQRDALEAWAEHYQVPEAPTSPRQTIGLIPAGNIPMVGFHDVLSIFIAGHRTLLKLSDRDKQLLPYCYHILADLEPRISAWIQFVDRLEGFDAVIATGSDNTARYFKTYFGKYPHIIRRNRTSVAILTGSETQQELEQLGQDIFQYFGLGCRNVSKVYVPESYDLDTLMRVLHEFKHLNTHTKYKNNFDYNITLSILNKEEYRSNGAIILKENPSLHSRIAELHYERYRDLKHLHALLDAHRDDLQCIVGTAPAATVPFGGAQQPALTDYADGVDTMAFLVGIGVD